MKAYRGLRTSRYTYVRNLDGPWLLYDNENDPYQKANKIGIPEYAEIQAQLESHLQQLLKRRGDDFLDGQAYLERDGFTYYHEVHTPCHRVWMNPWQHA